MTCSGSLRSNNEWKPLSLRSDIRIALWAALHSLPSHPPTASSIRIRIPTTLSFTVFTAGILYLFKIIPVSPPRIQNTSLKIKKTKKKKYKLVCFFNIWNSSFRLQETVGNFSSNQKVESSHFWIVGGEVRWIGCCRCGGSTSESALWSERNASDDPSFSYRIHQKNLRCFALILSSIVSFTILSVKVTPTLK